ncbi:hypothetical protein B0H13DRAFT_1037261 [Mycena leptocephala]|nr:hypothetical protein B0H13DRAFT_1037261 [Mycena leptocephala]
MPASFSNAETHCEEMAIDYSQLLRINSLFICLKSKSHFSSCRRNPAIVEKSLSIQLKNLIMAPVKRFFPVAHNPLSLLSTGLTSARVNKSNKHYCARSGTLPTRIFLYASLSQVDQKHIFKRLLAALSRVSIVHSTLTNPLTMSRSTYGTNFREFTMNILTPWPQSLRPGRRHILFVNWS